MFMAYTIVSVMCLVRVIVTKLPDFVLSACFSLKAMIYPKDIVSYFTDPTLQL